MLTDRTEQGLRDFAGCLWEPDDLIELRLIRGPKEPAKRRWIPAADITSCAGWAAGWNDDGFNCYAGHAPRTERGGGRTEHCAVFRSLLADWDGMGEAEVSILLENAGVPRPTVMLRTGGGVHAYWRLLQPFTDAQEWIRYQYGLSDTVGSDPAVNKPPQPMRVPGFWNVKRDYAEPRLCEIVHFDEDERFALDELGFDPRPRLNGRTRVVAPPPGGGRHRLAPSTVRWMLFGAPVGERYVTARRAAADAAGCGYSRNEILGLLLPGARACGFDEEKLEALAEWAASAPRYPEVDPEPDRGADFGILRRRLSRAQ